MTDKELLELAKKAIGFEGCEIKIGRRIWNPLIDDGDAFRLAVNLNLRVDCYDQQVETMDGCGPYKIGSETFTNTFVKIEPTDKGENKYAATRRAIVRAAASIGQSMEKPA
jgi:hypothetical protein